MFIKNKNELFSDKDDQIWLNESSYFDQAFDEPEYDLAAADIFSTDLFNFFQDLIDEALTEDFTSDYSAYRHFAEHCRGFNKKSKRSHVYYDFNDLDDYLAHESEVSKAVNNTTESQVITDLMDYPDVIKKLRRLFEGNRTVLFSATCNFTSSSGPCIIGLKSWSTQYTANYMDNTVDFIVETLSGKTITMFPLDASYVENKLNNLIERISKDILKLKINF